MCVGVYGVCEVCVKGVCEGVCMRGVWMCVRGVRVCVRGV